MSKFPLSAAFAMNIAIFLATARKKSKEELKSEKEDQWTQAKKVGNSNQNQRKKGTDGKKLKGDVAIGKLPQPQLIENVSSNQFSALRIPDAPVLEEGELPQPEGLVETPDLPMEKVVLSTLDSRDDDPLHSPKEAKVSPSYADITRKKQVVCSDSSDDDSVENFSKNIGRKTKKETREEEAERLKMQGSQPTIEMSYGRSKRSRPPKGVSTPSQVGK